MKERLFMTYKSKENSSPVISVLQEFFKRRKMMPDGNLDLHKG